MIRPVVTGDGSLTLFVPVPGEHYHSKFGAVTESRHIFINAGLNSLSFSENTVFILEVGFGTGLNALLTLAESSRKAFPVVYEAVEPFPLESETWSALNYPEITGNQELEKELRKMHEAKMDNCTVITPSFTLLKLQQEIEKSNFPIERYHLIYFDPFSPDSQPDIWVPEVFSKMFASLKPGGILVTYCVKGTVTRGFKEAGFEVEKLPGPPGKRHILRARKDV